MLHTVLQWTIVLVGFCSGVCWVRSACISTPLPKAYVSGAPKKVVEAIKSISRWNSAAAILAAITAFLQGIAEMVR